MKKNIKARNYKWKICHTNTSNNNHIKEFVEAPCFESALFFGFDKIEKIEDKKAGDILFLKINYIRPLPTISSLTKYAYAIEAYIERRYDSYLDGAKVSRTRLVTLERLRNEKVQ